MSKVALCAVAGLAVAGCQGSHATSAARSARSTAGTAQAGYPASSRSTGATAGHASGGQIAGAPSGSAANKPAATTPATAEPTATGLADVYVVANCAGGVPQELSREPLSITLACADAGIGVRDMLWGSWTLTTATGSGLLWEKLCVPDCATGKIGYYPVDVTLSAVRSSAKGPWFSELRVSWEGSRPPNQTPDTFQLTPPVRG